MKNVYFSPRRFYIKIPIKNCYICTFIVGIVQYTASLYVPESKRVALATATPAESRKILQDFVDEVNEIVAGMILTGGNELFFIELLASSQYK